MVERLEQSVVNSALWAAAGDALGWITELSRGPSGVAYRTGIPTVLEPIHWHRLIGGRNGPRVELPAGTYSDDTQLRLAVSRSIRGDGSFDVEAFAKIEVTVWPTYALGGGLGTKAAASNLSKRGVNWFSNFFDTSSQVYVRGGGNGAAMRIQPHVWASRGPFGELILDVLRDALVTHGHPHGFCGAVFHALVLSETMRSGKLPTVEASAKFADSFSELLDIISGEPQLAAFWQSAWENNARTSLHDALKTTREEFLRDIDKLLSIGRRSPTDAYHEALDVLGCLTPQYRGSGLKTALAALTLASAFREREAEEALACAANELESDTDTIATMAGALLGAVSTRPPSWSIQDRSYIIKEAKRLASIALGHPQDSFTYPDLARWNPPTKQTAAVGRTSDGLAIAGLGQLTLPGPEYRVGDAIWQWFTLSFGQTVLAKRSANLKERISDDQLPGPRQAAGSLERNGAKLLQPSLLSENEELGRKDKALSVKKRNRSIDEWTNEVIQSGFDDRVLGRVLNECIDTTQSLESAVALAAIVAKAKVARRRRR